VVHVNHQVARLKVESSRRSENRVLNAFAYTCGFSVAAAAGGAASVTSVDLSPGNLEWGRENFALNELDTIWRDADPDYPLRLELKSMLETLDRG